MSDYPIIFFLMQAAAVALFGLMMYLLVFKNARKRAVMLRRYIKLLKLSSQDNELDARLSVFSDNAVEYMNVWMAGQDPHEQSERLISSLTELNAFLRAKCANLIFLPDSLSDEEKLGRSTQIMTQIYLKTKKKGSE
jgi:hypothetical protein